MKVNIDLGSDGNGPCCAPICCDDDKKYYPSIYYTGNKELVLPKEGVMTIRYRKKGHSESTSDDGKESYSCTIEVREIVSVEGNGDDVEAPATNRSKASEDALDLIRAAISKEKKSKSSGSEY